MIVVGERTIAMQIGIGLGRTTFHLVARGTRSQVIVRKKFSRAQLLAYKATVPSSLIGMETDVASHFPGRTLREQGHEVRLIPTQFVREFVKSRVIDRQSWPSPAAVSVRLDPRTSRKTGIRRTALPSELPSLPVRWRS
jgi:hypothetical protein